MTGLLLALLTLAAPPVAPKARPTVRVEVVESAGGVAFVKPGEKAGLRTGQTVTIGGTTYKITSVSAETAAIDLAGGALAAGAAGEAPVARAESDRPSRATRPLPLTAFQGAWGTPVVPAALQHPTPVPLSARSAQSNGPWSALLQARAGQILPRTQQGAAFRQELVARGDARLSKEHELWLDGDGSVQAWNGPGLDPLPGQTKSPGQDSRPPARVRELRARWGAQADPYFAAGRLRHAAWSLGELDGARARAPFGPVSVAVFGGLLPDPLDHTPTSEAPRAGVEASWRGNEASWRPEVTLAAHASWFEGTLDERRVSGTASVVSPHASFFGWTEVSQFDANNPWNAKPVELTGAGGDGSVRFGVLRAGARVQTHSPERSLRMQAYLPPSWLCTSERLPPGQVEPCVNDSKPRNFAGGDLGIELHYLTLTGGGTAVYGPGQDEILGFAELRTLSLPHGLRIETGAFSSRGELVDRSGGHLGIGAQLLDERVEFFVDYHPQQASYRAFPQDTWVEQRFSGDLLVRVRPDAELGALVETNAGIDAPYSFVLVTATWRR